MFSDFAFGAGSQSMFFGDAPSGRLSVPPVTQESQDKKTRKSISAKQIEPGYFPVTIGMIHQAVKKGTIKPGHCYMHGQPCGVVKLVGYILEANDKGGVTEFVMTDGSGAITVTAEASSDNDEWFVSKLEVIKPGQIIRVVGTVHTSGSVADVAIRALHFCVPDPREYAYQHCIEVAYVQLSVANRIGDSHDVASKIADLSLSAGGSVEDVQLPSLFDDVTDRCHRSVLRYILDYRSENVGVKKETIHTAFQDRFKAQDVDDAVTTLLDEGHAFKTLEDYVDALAL